jgi:DNA-binding PadR family transcriptional regulator
MKLIKIIGENDGMFSWYQIDRQLSIEGIVPTSNLIKILHSLESDGLIISKVDTNPSQPLYSLTDKGRMYLIENK